jgi:hypothetical protein
METLGNGEISAATQDCGSGLQRPIIALISNFLFRRATIQDLGRLPGQEDDLLTALQKTVVNQP